MGWVTLQTTFPVIQCTCAFKRRPWDKHVFQPKTTFHLGNRGLGRRQHHLSPFPISGHISHLSGIWPASEVFTCFTSFEGVHLLRRYSDVSHLLKSSICPQSWLHYTNASDIQTLNFDLTKVRYIWWIAQTSLTMRNRKRQVWSHMDIFVVKQHGHLFCKNIFYHMFIYIYIYIDHICI